MPLEPEERFERTNVIDLVAALRKSIEESNAAEARAGKGPPPKKATSACEQGGAETGLRGFRRFPSPSGCLS
jgi:hypothetical protein